MYAMYVVRKQLYIEERHERELERRAKALGVTEADIVRQALDTMLEREQRPHGVPDHRKALREVSIARPSLPADAVPSASMSG